MSEVGQGRKCKKYNINSMLIVGFQSPGIILWSRHSIGGLSCLGGGLRSMNALVTSLLNKSGVPGLLRLNIFSLLTKWNIFKLHNSLLMLKRVVVFLVLVIHPSLDHRRGWGVGVGGCFRVKWIR